jgi:hypothetical protein
MNNIAKINRDDELRLSNEACFAAEKIRAIGKFLNFISKDDIYMNMYPEFVQNCGEILESEIEKINQYTHLA